MRTRRVSHDPLSRAPLAALLRHTVGLIALALILSACGSARQPQEPAPTGQAGRPSAVTRTEGLPEALKIYVDRPGIYRLDAQSLGLEEPVPWERVRLVYGDNELPVFPLDGGLLFYAPPPPADRYAREAVIWLTFDARQQALMEEAQAGPANHAARSAFMATAVAEENLIYQPLAGGTEPWFWAQVAAPATWEAELTLDHVVAEGEAILRVSLWAKTKAPVNPDHHWRLFVNGQQVADITRDGDGPHVLEVTLPAQLLREGSNTVRLEAVNDLGVADISFVDRVALVYPRAPVAQEGRLVVESEGGLYRVTGLDAPALVFDVTDPLAPRRVDGVPQEGDTLLLNGEPSRRYEVVSADTALQPPRVALPTLAPDLRALDGGDYVIIAPSALMAALEPLKRHREAQGLRVRLLPAEALFDQFGDGQPRPEAIRAFLQHARQAWEPPPRYVLLVGDTTYDFQAFTVPPEVNQLPTFMVSTIFGGETASDVLLAQLDDDPWPDVALGRIPAGTPEQVERVVSKILAYEQQSGEQPWRRRVLAVADAWESRFADDARRFLDQVTPFETELLSPPVGAPDGVDRVVSALEAGAFMVTYFGHGSVTQWGRDRLLTSDEAIALRNADRLSIVINMTCLTGLFTHPQATSLAESMLWAEGGAVAVLAPTSLTLPGDQSFLADAITSALGNSPERLGDLFLQAQRQVPVEGAGTRDVLYTFLLLGDPALVLPTAEDVVRGEP